MIARLSKVLEAVETWSQEDQNALFEAVQEITAQRRGIYVMTEAERAAVDAGLDEALRGEIATEDEVTSLWNRLG